MSNVPRCVSVLGTGYLGAVHAACMADLGHHVVAVDTDAAKIDALAAGRPPFFEPGLAELLARVLPTGRLRFTTDYAEAAGATVHFICVGTPQQPGSERADLSYVWGAVDSIAPLLTSGSLVVGKSTVPVGTAATLIERLRSRVERGVDVRLAWNPEFLREGFAIEDTVLPSRIVYGVAGSHAQADVAMLDEVYASALGFDIPRMVTDLATAELVKTSANAFLATKLSFINGIADLCEASGADVIQLADALGLDDRIGRKFLGAGLGYGGGCLPKDVRALIASAAEHGAESIVSLLTDVDQMNTARRGKVVDLAESLCDGDLRGRTIAILGLAFKPDSDDIRESSALEVARGLALRGATVQVHDPRALDRVRLSHPELAAYDDVLDACRDADLVLHLTEWRDYRGLDPRRVAVEVASPTLVEARNALDLTAWRSAGWTCHSIGRPATPSRELRETGWTIRTEASHFPAVAGRAEPSAVSGGAGGRRG